jgi:hypothetical protein
MQLISTVTLASNNTTILFNNIPQTFTDLYVVCSVRGTRTNWDDDLRVTFNGSTSGYGGGLLYSAGDGTGSFGSTTFITMLITGTVAANAFSNCSLYIPNYTQNSTKLPLGHYMGETSQTNHYVGIGGYSWVNSAAITSINLSVGNSSNWIPGSSASLYGILKGNGQATITSP